MTSHEAGPFAAESRMLANWLRTCPDRHTTARAEIG